MKTIKYYHKNSDKLAFKRIEYSHDDWEEFTYNEKGNIITYKDSSGFSYETTYDEKGNRLTYKDSSGISYKKTYDKNNNQLTYKDSSGLFLIKGEEVSEDEYNNFIFKRKYNQIKSPKPCCTELKAENKKLSFKDWKYSKGMRYLSGHIYKDNDGDIYDSDELEAMYENYLSF